MHPGEMDGSSDDCSDVERALVNVMHPVHDIHSWKASLVPDVWHQ